MKKKNLLVVTPTLGNRESLLRTINSVKNVNDYEIKHILITPKEKYLKLKSNFPDCDIFEEPENCKGIYEALNYVFNKFGSNFTHLTYINDDDFWLDKYVILIDKIFSNDNIDVIYGKVTFVDLSGNLLNYQTSTKWYKSFETLYFLNIVLFTQQAVIMKSEVFFRVGGFDQTYKLIADSKFWIDAIRLKYNFKFVNKFVAAYSTHSDTISSKILHDKENEILKLNLKSNYLIIRIFEIARFRLFNISIYISRLFHKRKLKSSHW